MKSPTSMLKRTYIAASALYLIAIITWFNRDPIAYTLTGAVPHLIEKRSLTPAEYAAWLRVPKVDHTITLVFILISALFGLTSLLFLKKNWFHPPIIPRIAVIIALGFAIFLAIAQSISFIAPGPLT